MTNKKFERILRATQDSLYSGIKSAFEGKAEIWNREGEDGYILIKGEAPVLLLAHLDTVHKESVHKIKTKGVTDTKTNKTEIRISSPQGIGGDDRCGVYGILTVYEQSEVKPWLLFCKNEEIGCVGSNGFAFDYKAQDSTLPREELDQIKFMIELDRKGSVDSVYYSCANDEFEQWINGFGFISDYGSWSDICEVAPAMHKAAVNLSSGYYNAHAKDEYIVESELGSTIEKVKQIVAESVKDETPAFEYIEEMRSYYSLADYYGRGKSKSSNSWSWSNIGSDWDNWDYHSEADYRDRCVAEKLGNVSVNFLIDRSLSSAIWAEYIALLDYYSENELEDIRRDFGDWGIIDAFQFEFENWELYYYSYIEPVEDESVYY